MAAIGSKFRLEYTSLKTGERMWERPRLLISADGKYQSLVVDNDPLTFLASLPCGSSEEELWQIARQKMQPLPAR
jgi:hypothetical protein